MTVTSSTKPFILVVDDMPDMTIALKFWLEDAGYEVQIAMDGLMALTLAKARMPDLVICDVVLPSMLGWELCLRLKERALPKKLPVIMLTGKSTEYDEIRSYESNADDHFTKPPDYPKLLAAIERHLSARNAP